MSASTTPPRSAASSSRGGVPYAYAVESDEPIVLQHSRLDTSGGYALFHVAPPTASSRLSMTLPLRQGLYREQTTGR
jgi:hypothetical protein